MKQGCQMSKYSASVNVIKLISFVADDKAK